MFSEARDGGVARGRRDHLWKEDDCYRDSSAKERLSEHRKGTRERRVKGRECRQNGQGKRGPESKDRYTVGQGRSRRDGSK